jgi:hypothetical protein
LSLAIQYDDLKDILELSQMYLKTEHGLWRLCQTTPCRLALHSEKSML